MIKISDWKT